MSAVPPGPVAQALDEFTSVAVQAGLDHVDGDDRVDRLWVYVTLAGHSIEVAWFFRVGGRPLLPGAAARELGLADADVVGLNRRCRPARDALLAALVASGALPQRIVVEHDPASGRTDVAWDRDVRRADESDGQLRDRWIVDHGGDPVFA